MDGLGVDDATARAARERYERGARCCVEGRWSHPGAAAAVAAAARTRSVRSEKPGAAGRARTAIVSRAGIA